MSCYCIAGKFGESSMIRQTKAIQISSYNYNLMALSIHQTFPRQTLKKSEFAEVSPAKLFRYTVYHGILCRNNLICTGHGSHGIYPQLILAAGMIYVVTLEFQNDMASSE